MINICIPGVYIAIYLVPSRKNHLCGKPCTLKNNKNYYKGKTNMWKTLFNGTLYLAIQTREPMEPISKTQHGEFWESLTHLLCHIAIVKLNSFSFDQHVILWSLHQLHFHVFSHVLSASHPWPLTP